MAGSRRAFVYLADNGDRYVVQLDESTYEQSELGFANNSLGGTTPIPIVRGNPIKMRYVNCYRRENGVVVRRRFFVGDPATSIYLTGGQLQLGGTSGADAVEAGGPWFVSSSVGERKKFIGFEDTGKTDGDVDQPASGAGGGGGT